MNRLRELFAPEEDDLPPTERSRRDWIVDSAIFVGALALGGVAVGSSIQHGLGGWLLVVDIVLGVAMTCTLWWRRRIPGTLAILTLVLGPLSSSAGPAGIVILYTLAAYRRWQAAVLVALVGLTLLPVEHAVHPDGESIGSLYVGAIVFSSAVLAWGMFRRSRRQTKHERERRGEVEEQLRVEQIRHAERTRSAREMHDVLGHRISLLSLHAGALEFRPDASPEEVAKAAGVIRASAHQALEDLRDVIGVLRDGTTDEAPEPPQPTLAALPGLLEESRAAGMQLDADIQISDLDTVPGAVGRHALRIVQEALTNARKHAADGTVALVLDGRPGRGLTIEVRNPTPVAAGTSAIPGSGAGLVGLAERAALSGGRLEHGLDERGDFRVRAWLPWPE
jgi:signal transduction histidine kinase